ncbi:5'-methylthioadenosine/adenosylhomocysteine nucleosidase [Hominifimenecus sp. rT4P-3]|uniref:5'-methylthioadenosine/adenosylhomocysteine nucleosidase n=1 Tax=Hominifimenecus sp. rT4P-3 TaxID=3242979 RepID=UPI003DA47FF2
MIGIIGAMPEEVELLYDAMEDKKGFSRAGLNIYQGMLKGVPAAVTCAGVGKVNAAMCAQILISEYKIAALINTGVAGGVAPDVHMGDIVISTDAMYHDFDTTALGTPLGQVTYMETSIFPADARLRALAADVCRRLLPEGACHEGRIVSGDQFIQGKEKQRWLYETFHASCTEMEGAAIAHVAYCNQVPFLIIRSISDGADDDSSVDFETFKGKAIRIGTDILLELFANGVGK